ncbi:MAG TPA: NosD domain-containing protein [Candidatus Bathyarchaeia archaeon]|nr:NosD domain-containing protein [Candidatus Bathyarchaeia archaeon]
MYMDIYNDTGAVVNLGNPVINNNAIQNCGDNIEFEDVEYATITRDMIVNNVGKTGVHLDSGSNYTEIHTNCFYNNTPQAMDNGTGNNWDGNYWSDYIGSGPYSIEGTANNTDNDPLDECPLGEGPPTPAQVPALTPVGLIALIGLLSAIAALSVNLRKRL